MPGWLLKHSLDFAKGVFLGPTLLMAGYSLLQEGINHRRRIPAAEPPQENKA
jgi:hypothetical protein